MREMLEKEKQKRNWLKACAGLLLVAIISMYGLMFHSVTENGHVDNKVNVRKQKVTALRARDQVINAIVADGIDGVKTEGGERKKVYVKENKAGSTKGDNSNSNKHSKHIHSQCLSTITSANYGTHMVTPPAGSVTLVCCVTTKGVFNIAVHPTWAPIGAANFLNMVTTEFFSTKIALFRALKGFIIQFGLSSVREMDNDSCEFRVGVILCSY